MQRVGEFIYVHDKDASETDLPPMLPATEAYTFVWRLARRACTIAEDFLECADSRYESRRKYGRNMLVWADYHWRMAQQLELLAAPEIAESLAAEAEAILESERER